MARACEKCGKKTTAGHNVSHSVRRTKRVFRPNLAEKKVFDPQTGETTKMKICTACLRTMAKVA